MLTRYEQLVYEVEGYPSDNAAAQAANDFLADYPEDIWEHDWWTSYDYMNDTWRAGAEVSRIVPDAKDME